MIPELVSTIIPVYNRPQMLQTAVESVIQQTYRPIEIIIADDGSTDETPTVAQQLIKEYPEIIHYYYHKNAGPGPARELGRVHATGEFIQYLDSDDRLLPNKFSDQVNVLRDQPDADIAYGCTNFIDFDGTVLNSPFKWTGKKIPFLFPGLLVDRWWCTHTPLYRRRLTDKIGTWCDMRWSQDWEYDARAGALGAKLVHCNSFVSEHCHHREERQTSYADWEKDPIRLKNRVQLMSVLLENAKLSKVTTAEKEWSHFSRWAFAITRNCAAVGLSKEAKLSLDISLEAAHLANVSSFSLNGFYYMSNLVGTRLTGILFKGIEIIKPGVGSQTLLQSFMTEKSS